MLILCLHEGKSPVNVKEEPKTDSDSDGSSENSEEDEDDDDGERESGDDTDLITRIKQEILTDEQSLKRRKGRPRKRRRLDDAQPPSPQPRYLIYFEWWCEAMLHLILIFKWRKH